MPIIHTLYIYMYTGVTLASIVLGNAWWAPGLEVVVAWHGVALLRSAHPSETLLRQAPRCTTVDHITSYHRRLGLASQRPSPPDKPHKVLLPPMATGAQPWQTPTPAAQTGSPRMHGGATKMPHLGAHPSKSFLCPRPSRSNSDVTFLF